MSRGNPNNVIPFPNVTNVSTSLPKLGLFNKPALSKQKNLDGIELHQLNIDNFDIQSSLVLLDKLSNKYSHNISPEIHQLLAAKYDQIANKFSFPCGREHCYSKALFHSFVATNKLNQTASENKAQQLKTRGILTQQSIEQIKMDAKKFISNYSNPTPQLRFTHHK